MLRCGTSGFRKKFENVIVDRVHFQNYTVIDILYAATVHNTAEALTAQQTSVYLMMFLIARCQSAG